MDLGARSSFYDSTGNLTKIDYPTMTDVEMQYDVLDRVTNMVDGLGTRSFGYDNLNRVTTVNGVYGNDVVTYSYDNLGRRSAMGVQQGGSGTATIQSTSYAYDNLDRLSSLTSPAGTWNYNYVGNTGKLDVVTNPNQTRVEYSYDGLDRLTQVENRKSAGQNNELISRYAYALSNRDIRTSVQKTVGSNDTQTTNYSYDETDQLTGETASETAALTNVPYVNNSFNYDAMGNRSTFGSTALANGGNTTSFSTSTVVNRLNQITSQTLTTLVNGTPSSTRTDAFNYDANGNLNTQSNNQNSANTSYTYDEADRLTQVVLKDSAGVNSKKSEYRYDGFSRKVVSKEYSWDANTAAWVKDDEVRRIYDGMDVVQERDDQNAVKVNYTRSGNIGGLLSKTDTASGSTFFYHYDGSGNVTQMSDVNQASVAEYSYDAYGQTLRAVGTQASGNRYRYSTKEWQTFTGLYDYGYRFYSPALGRWINRDPIRESGGLNLYGMVGNDPVNKGDSRGLTGFGIGDIQNSWNRGVDRVNNWLNFTDRGDPRWRGAYNSAMDAQRRYFPDEEDPWTGSYRHCVAACLVRRRFGDLGDLFLYPRQMLQEVPNLYQGGAVGRDSWRDMRAEAQGMGAVASGCDSCATGCLKLYGTPPKTFNNPDWEGWPSGDIIPIT